MTYNEFLFDSYRYDRTENALTLAYRFLDGPRFAEKLTFDFPSRQLCADEQAVLDRIFRLIFLMAGVSYYKAYVPQTLRCAAFPLDCDTAGLLQKFYEKGLAEFAWKNRLSLAGRCRFDWEPIAPPPPLAVPLPRRTCVPIGGGKDSLVTLECLRAASEDLVLFSLGDAAPIASCIAAAGLPFIRVCRRLDPVLLELNKGGALNGHVPITGILSAIALACAVLAGFDVIAMSNEHSASVPNLVVDGVGINHQYSKSLEFEIDFAAYLATQITPSIAYFSLLRPLPEIEIARRFAQRPQYFGIFRSCNTAFRQSPAERGRHWCGDCPKCRFVFLALAPFVAKNRLVAIFGRNLLDDDNQTDGFAELCGLRAHKPFECVGEIAESAAVMAYLAGARDWQDDTVVRRLRARFSSLGENDPEDFRTLLSARHPHRVPATFLAKLDACG
jgi:UDP-N-acetyl-alpha-D-muramoyl-L-alanyl-L-glutamate epimerase